ncbi:MAG: SGNH/GDSL hydrolase family protein [Clostridia bacterium]|nr:SGNH/GDSL hydrolase family protein [Clostridia bacterium]
MKKRILSGVCATVAVIVIWQLLTALMTPKYMTSIPEGALIAEYYEETSPHQVLFVGDCEVYENFSPITLWEEYGITSYIRGSAQQLIWQSYYLLDEMLRRESPEAVVFNVLSVKYGTPQNEAYNRMSIDGMRWSSSKWGAVQASMTEEEDAITYLFPLLRYHSRWNELSGEDITYLFRRDRVGYNGYLMQTGVRPVTSQPPWVPLEDYTVPQTCMDYLDKMREICEHYGVELILIKAPSIYPLWYEEWDAQIAAYAEAHGLAYYNFLAMSEEIGIDWERDTYDAGLHLNVWGAEKLSTYFGKLLTEKHGLTSQKNDAVLSGIWAEKCAAYAAEKANAVSPY